MWAWPPPRCTPASRCWAFIWDGAPGQANLAGFAAAFALGFHGHLSLTFADRALAAGPALLRYAMLSCASFALGQGMVLAAHSWQIAPAELVQLSVMLLVAALNYALSTAWAFSSRAGVSRRVP